MTNISQLIFISQLSANLNSSSQILPDTTRMSNLIIPFWFNASAAYHIALFSDEDKGKLFIGHLNNEGAKLENGWYTLPSHVSLDGAVREARSLGGQSYYLKEDGWAVSYTQRWCANVTDIHNSETWRRYSHFHGAAHDLPCSFKFEIQFLYLYTETVLCLLHSGALLIVDLNDDISIQFTWCSLQSRWLTSHVQSDFFKGLEAKSWTRTSHRLRYIRVIRHPYGAHSVAAKPVKRGRPRTINISIRNGARLPIQMLLGAKRTCKGNDDGTMTVGGHGWAEMRKQETWTVRLGIKQGRLTSSCRNKTTFIEAFSRHSAALFLLPWQRPIGCWYPPVITRN